jgi:hypothetical protein
VFGSDANHVFAAGSSGLIIARDAGGNWSNQSMGGAFPPTFSEGWAAGNTDFWMATTSGATRSNGAGVWAYEQSSGAATQGNGLWGFSSSDLWLSFENDTGTLAAPVNATTLYHYNGSGWTTETPATPGGFLALWGTSDSDLYAYGVDVENQGSGAFRNPIIAHRNAAGTWARQPNGPGLITTGGTNCGVTSMWGFGKPATNIYATLKGSGIYHSAGDGTWTAVPNAPAGTSGPKVACSAVWGASSSALWFACKNVVFSYDGNATWATTLTDPNVTAFSAIWGTSATNVYAVGGDGTNAIIYHLY